MVAIDNGPSVAVGQMLIRFVTRGNLVQQIRRWLADRLGSRLASRRTWSGPASDEIEVNAQSGIWLNRDTMTPISSMPTGFYSNRQTPATRWHD